MGTTISNFHGPWGFLSNFHPSFLVWEGVQYSTGEHAYNAGKPLDPAERFRISCALTPGTAKRMGRALPLRPDWDKTARYDVMWDVLWAKFTCHPRRIDALLRTGDAYLSEGNTWHDQHWGNCLCARPACTPPGGNHLGRLLMELRSTLRATWKGPAMTYTTQGLMTPLDRQDYEELTDTGRNPQCPGHDDEEHRLGLIYCARAENCPDAMDDDIGLIEAGQCLVDSATGWCVTHKRYEA